MDRPKNSLSFLGATETVTGSRYLIGSNGKRILIDCGLFQGYKNLRLKNWQEFPVPPDSIDLVLITHAHLDHSGYVPALAKHGFRGKVLMTTGTAELCEIMWRDSAHLLEEEAERANRKGYTKHKPAKPLYNQDDVERALDLVRTVHFDKEVELAAGIKAKFIHAGHILGAAQLQLTVNGKRIHFSGDLGRANDPLLNPPAALQECDILVTESTYGDRTHPNVDPELELKPILKEVLERGGTVVIPAFAVGRTQALMLHTYRLMQRGEIPTVPIFVNSPMAENVTAMYHNHQEEHRINLEEFEAMYSVAKMVHSVEESKELNVRKGAKIIIAASGMMTGGRVLHHVIAYGTDPKNAIVISGYQAGGTRGRLLAEGERTLRIFGKDVEIRAEVFQLETLSGHADADELIAWLRGAPKPPTQTYVIHGEPAASDRMRFRIESELGWSARAPFDREVIDIDNPS